MKRFWLAFLLLLAPAVHGEERPRARDAGIEVGVFRPGPLNAITDVRGVRVGHVTVTSGQAIHTGVTAILPHGDNLFERRVPAAIHVANGFGKLLGISQVRELGELETPILLTCTLCVWRAADTMVEFLLEQPGMETVRSINPVVGETNDGYLNDIRSRAIEPRHVVEALTTAADGPVAEGNVGAGTGTVAFGFKGGIGTSSRVLPDHLGGHSIGVLVQANFGGILSIAGAPVGRSLDRYAFRDDIGDSADGSIMIVVATDAPLDARLLERLARRSLAGLARTGAAMTNGSGDYVIAFSTTGKAEALVSNDRMSPLFQAVAEATEEAIYNALFKAETTEGHRGRIDALPIDRTLEILDSHDARRKD
ncbi:MAG: P1 family peptidase [Xanthomonadales bacterium]|nr:P1 family peptidase [Xanthomonadales bacterium]